VAGARVNQPECYTSELACPSGQENTLFFPFCPPF
jgi:hypothetical protein